MNFFLFIPFSLLALASALKQKDKASLDDLQNDFSDFLKTSNLPLLSKGILKVFECGLAGVCGQKCCQQREHNARARTNSLPPASTVRNFPMTAASGPRLPYKGVTSGGTPYDVEVCPEACQPHCLDNCIQRYEQFVASVNTVFKSRELSRNKKHRTMAPSIVFPAPAPSQIRVENEYDEEPVCNPECMPTCTRECLEATNNPPMCQSNCMPQCDSICVNSPPAIVPCPTTETTCYCPAGYVQCGENACCMRYRSMIRRYKNKVVKSAFGDEPITNSTTSKEQHISMFKYIEMLRKMGISNASVVVNSSESGPDSPKIQESRREI